MGTAKTSQIPNRKLCGFAMEKPQSETPKSFDFSFPPYRRSPLKSETYGTLVRILSLCHGQSQCSLTTQISPQDLLGDNGGSQLVQACENSGLVALGSDAMGPENMLAPTVDEHHESFDSQDRVCSDTQRRIDVIEDIMREEDGKGLPRPEDKIIDEGFEGSGREQMILDELQHLLDGKDELAQENSGKLSTLPVEENNSFNDIFGLIGNEDSIDLQQIIMEEPGDAGQLQVDKELHNQKVSGSVNSSSDNNVVKEMPKLNDSSPEKNSSLKTNVLEADPEMKLQGRMEFEKPASTCGMMSSPVPMIEDEDIEEGEVSGDIPLDDMSVDLFCEGAITSKDRNKNEMQISEGLLDKQYFHHNEKSDEKEKDSNSNSSVIDMVDSGGKVEPIGSNTNKIMSKPALHVHETSVEVTKAYGDDFLLETRSSEKEGSGARESLGTRAAYPKTLVYYGDILESSSTQKTILKESATKNKSLLSTEQENAVDLKKKIGSSRSGGSKERKKEKKRKKRALKNRQLGVKRLKLQPVMKPKTVSYCRHYLKGRCQEGEKCKFSHDTIPSTKSTACCHFARNSCMKGDDCPFDHELSKYPCRNYASTGSCNRGDACLFSHQTPLKQDSPADVISPKPELKLPSLLGDSSSKKKQSTSGSANHIVNALSYSGGINSRIKTEKSVAGTMLKPPELAPKGISFISLGKPSMVESSKPKQVSSHLKMDNGVRVGHQIEQRAPPTVQILNETPKRTSPPVAPKGINFLSFGKPLGSLSGIMSSNRDRIEKLSASDNQIISKPAISLPTQDNCVAVGKQKAESALAPFQNEILKKIQPAEAPLGQTVSSAKSANLYAQDSLPYRCSNVGDGSSQEKQILSDKAQSSSVTQSKMLAPFTSGESSKHSASGTYRNTSNSVQKAMWSTLAFAAKYESGIKINQTTGTAAANAEANKEIGTGTSSGVVKAAKILEFLSSFGNKTKK